MFDMNIQHVYILSHMTVITIICILCCISLCKYIAVHHGSGVTNYLSD